MGILVGFVLVILVILKIDGVIWWPWMWIGILAGVGVALVVLLKIAFRLIFPIAIIILLLAAYGYFSKNHHLLSKLHLH